MAKPGKLDQRIEIQQPSNVSDGGGGFTKTFAKIASVWAHVRANSGREIYEDERTNALSLATFTIRNRSDVFENDRIVWNAEKYNVRQVRREGVRAMYLQILAERGANSFDGVTTTDDFSSAFSEAFS